MRLTKAIKPKQKSDSRKNRRKNRTQASADLSLVGDLASLRDIARVMKTPKSTAAEKHLDDRIRVWIRRYKRRDPVDCKDGVEEFGSRTGGGSGGVGVTKGLAEQIYNELK